MRFEANCGENKGQILDLPADQVERLVAAGKGRAIDAPAAEQPPPAVPAAPEATEPATPVEDGGAASEEPAGDHAG